MIYLVAALWFFAAVLSTAFANRLKISIALMEIIVGTIVGFVAFQLGYFAVTTQVAPPWGTTD